jgi:hypothetical protein
MDKLTFKYDIMHLFNDRCEFKYFKKKPFFEKLVDIFVSKLSYVIFIIPFFVLILHSIHVPIEIMHIFILIIPFFLFAIMTYYEQHKDVSILISDIRKLYVSRNRKTLRIVYKDGKFLRIKTVDLPDGDANQYIVNKLNEANLSVENNYSSSDFLVKQIKFYRLNLYFGMIGFLISLLFVFILLNISKYNFIVFLFAVFSLSFCMVISIYNFYKLTKLKRDA